MNSRHSGFTLFELLAVIAVIAILMGLGIRGLGIARINAKKKRAKADIETIRIALDEFRVEYGVYPELSPAGPFSDLPRESLVFLTNAVEGVQIVDPWGNPYYYKREAGLQDRFKYQIWSLGVDGEGSTSTPDGGSEQDKDNISPSITGY